MLGLKRGTVELVPHQTEWDENASKTIMLLKEILGETALDIQHIGSTAVRSIRAKPIIDIVVGVGALKDIESYLDALKRRGIWSRGQYIEQQWLLVMGDMEKDIRTHHIHVVDWQSRSWENYLNFRDYLNAFPEKARLYEKQKQRLADAFPNDRQSYTRGKQEQIDALLKEARIWRGQ